MTSTIASEQSGAVGSREPLTTPGNISAQRAGSSYLARLAAAGDSLLAAHEPPSKAAVASSTQFPAKEGAPLPASQPPSPLTGSKLARIQQIVQDLESQKQQQQPAQAKQALKPHQPQPPMQSQQQQLSGCQQHAPGRRALIPARRSSSDAGDAAPAGTSSQFPKPPDSNNTTNAPAQQDRPQGDESQSSHHANKPATETAAGGRVLTAGTLRFSSATQSTQDRLAATATDAMSESHWRLEEQEADSGPHQQREEHWQRLHVLQQQHLQEQRQQSHAQARARRASAPGDSSASESSNSSNNCAQPVSGVTFSPLRQSRFSVTPAAGASVHAAAEASAPRPEQSGAHAAQEQKPASQQRSRPPSLLAAALDILVKCDLDSEGWSLQSGAGLTCEPAAAQQPTEQVQPDELLSTCASTCSAQAAKEPDAAEPSQPQSQQDEGDECEAVGASKPSWVICTLQRKASVATDKQKHADQKQPEAQVQGKGKSRPSSPLSPRLGLFRPKQQQQQQQAQQLEEAMSADDQQLGVQVADMSLSLPLSPLAPRLGWFRPKQQVQLEQQQQQQAQQLEEATSADLEQLEGQLSNTSLSRPLSPTSRRLGWFRQKQQVQLEQQQQQQAQQQEEAMAADMEQPETQAHHKPESQPSSPPCPKLDGYESKQQEQQELQAQQQQQHEALSTDKAQPEAQLQDRPKSPPSSPSSPRLGWFRKKQHMQLEHLHQLQEALLVQHLEQQQLEQQKQQQAMQIEKLQAALMLQQGQHHKRLDEVRAQGQTEMQLLLKETQEARRQDHEKVKQLQWLLLEQQESVQHDLLQEYEQRQKAMKSREADLEQQHKELQQQLDVQVEQYQVLEARVEVLQLKSEQACEEKHGLQEQLAQAQAENAELQLQCLQAKKKANKLQEEQEKLLESNIELQERQQRLMLQQLHHDKDSKAAKAQLQAQQDKALQELAVREESLNECHRQLQEAKALLQAEVELQHAHIKEMIQRVQEQEQLMIADVRAAKGTYLVDLKAETQRNQELTQQLTGQKAKFKEANSKLRQLQKDHGRLLDRKLEADRRVTTLQQKLQQLRQNRDAAGNGSNGSSSGSKSSANGMRAATTSASGGRAGSGNAGVSSRSIGSTCEAQPSLLGGSCRPTIRLQAQQQPGDMQQQVPLSPPVPTQWPTLQQQQQQQQPGAVAAALEEGAATADANAAFVAEQHARMAAEAKAAGLESENRILSHIISSLSEELDPLLQGMSQLQHMQAPYHKQQQQQQRQRQQQQQQQRQQQQQDPQVAPWQPRQQQPSQQQQQQEQQQQQQQQPRAFQAQQPLWEPSQGHQELPGVFLSPVKGLVTENNMTAEDSASQLRSEAAAAILRQQVAPKPATFQLYEQQYQHQEQPTLCQQQQAARQHKKRSQALQQQQQRQQQTHLPREAGAQRRLLPVFACKSGARAAAQAAEATAELSSARNPRKAAAAAAAAGTGCCPSQTSWRGRSQHALRLSDNPLFGFSVHTAAGSMHGDEIMRAGQLPTDWNDQLQQQQQQQQSTKVPLNSHSGMQHWQFPKNLPAFHEMLGRWPAAQQPWLCNERSTQQPQDQAEADQQQHTHYQMPTMSYHVAQQQQDLDSGPAAAGVMEAACSSRADRRQAGLPTAVVGAVRTAFTLQKQGDLMSPPGVNSPLPAAPEDRDAQAQDSAADRWNQPQQQQHHQAACARLCGFPQQQQQQGGCEAHQLLGFRQASQPGELRSGFRVRSWEGLGFSSPKEYSSSSSMCLPVAEGSLMLPCDSSTAAVSCVPGEHAVAEAAVVAAKCRTMCDKLHDRLGSMLGAPTAKVPARSDGAQKCDVADGALVVRAAAFGVVSGSRSRSGTGRMSGRSSIISKGGSAVLLEQWNELQRQVQEVEGLMLSSEASAASTFVTSRTALTVHTSADSRRVSDDGCPSSSSASTEQYDDAAEHGQGFGPATPRACMTTAEAMDNQALVNLAVNMIGTRLCVHTADTGSNEAQPHQDKGQVASSQSTEATAAGDEQPRPDGAAGVALQWGQLTQGLPGLRGLLAQSRRAVSSS